VAAAVLELSKAYDVEQTQIEADLLELCRGMLERGLIEIVDEQAA
jgi:hypothetical protein